MIIFVHARRPNGIDALLLRRSLTIWFSEAHRGRPPNEDPDSRPLPARWADQWGPAATGTARRKPSSPSGRVGRARLAPHHAATVPTWTTYNPRQPPPKRRSCRPKARGHQMPSVLRNRELGGHTRPTVQSPTLPAWATFPPRSAWCPNCLRSEKSRAWAPHSKAGTGRPGPDPLARQLRENRTLGQRQRQQGRRHRQHRRGLRLVGLRNLLKFKAVPAPRSSSLVSCTSSLNPSCRYRVVRDLENWIYRALTATLPRSNSSCLDAESPQPIG